jgi:5-methylcytosine-specific restriction endonuclease McrA
VDHVVALARGGSNTRDNIQILCRSCNSAKQDRDNSEFFLSRQLVGVESAPAAPPAS